MIKTILSIILLIILPIATDSSLAQPPVDTTGAEIYKANDSLKLQVNLRFRLDSLINSNDTLK